MSETANTGSDRAMENDAFEDDVAPSDDGLYQAWCVIANARDWLLEDAQAEEWREAASRWRDEIFHPSLAALVAERATTETLDREWRAACLAEQVLRQRVKVADDALDAERALSDTLAAALEASWLGDSLPGALKAGNDALAAWRVARA